MVYDCLFPHTIGGAERWYRQLALRLSQAGHDVTYVTMPQWDGTETRRASGCSGGGGRAALRVCTRTVGGEFAPPLLFGFGVLRHLAIHGSQYEVVHLVSFPYFPLLAAALLRRIRRYRIVVDWFEVWTREYWDEYLGVSGRVGYWVQAALRPRTAGCVLLLELHERRLRAAGVRGPVTVLRGLYEGELSAREPLPAEPVVVFAGRHIPEKRVTAIVPCVLRCTPGGPGPGLCDLRGRARARRGTAPDRVVRAPGRCRGSAGFVEQEQVEQALSRALCIVLPSRREGYGLIVVEGDCTRYAGRRRPRAGQRGRRLVEEGVNGYRRGKRLHGGSGGGNVRVHRAGAALRHSTCRLVRTERPGTLDRELSRSDLPEVGGTCLSNVSASSAACSAAWSTRTPRRRNLFVRSLSKASWGQVVVEQRG